MAKRTDGKFTIRKAFEKDKDDIYRVHTKAIQETCSSHYGPNEVEVWLRRQDPGRYLEFLRQGEIMIAEDQDERVVGFGHATSDTILNEEIEDQGKFHAVHIKGLFVDPEQHRKGAGSSLMNHLEKTASGLGAKILTVHATLNAVEFYRKCGFDPLEFVEHRVSDEVCLQCRKMIKKLDD